MTETYGAAPRHMAEEVERLRRLPEEVAARWRRRAAQQAPLRNVNQQYDEQLTSGQRAADRIATLIGSWWFIAILTLAMLVWTALNLAAWRYHWDPYPFNFLSLVIGVLATYTAPIIMMSQNRQALKDRLAAEQDFAINVRAEQGVHEIVAHLEYQNDLMLEMLRRLDAQAAQSSATGSLAGDDRVAPQPQRDPDQDDPQGA